MNTKATELVIEYKGKQTWEEMAQAINSTPRMEKPVSRAQVNNWGIGVGTPPYYFLTHLEREGDGWVSRFAADMLRIITE